MPVIVATGNISPGSFGVRTPGMSTASLSSAQAGSGPSDNVVDRGGSAGPVLLRLVTTVGATPTCTYAIEGSPAGTVWFPIQYADSAAPQPLGKGAGPPAGGGAGPAGGAGDRRAGREAERAPWLISACRCISSCPNW